MALNMRKDPQGDSKWMRIPECDECNSMAYYAEDATWTFIAEDTGWRINGYTGAVTCDACLTAAKVEDKHEDADGIRALRIQRGHSIQDLADLAGVSSGTLRGWEHGRTPWMRTVRRVAQALDVPVSALLK